MLCYESESPSAVSDSWQPHGLYSAWNSPGQNTGVGTRPPRGGCGPVGVLRSWGEKYLNYTVQTGGCLAAQSFSNCVYVAKISLDSVQDVLGR